MNTKESAKKLIFDLLITLLAGAIVGTGYHIFQNSNGFAPGGVGGFATITHHLLGDMMRILRSYPDTFASFSRVNEVFGNFKHKV